MKYNDNYIPKDKDESIGNLLKNRRKELGLSLTKVSSLTNIRVQQYCRFESDKRSLASASFYVALSICNALKLDPNRILDKEKAVRKPHDF